MATRALGKRKKKKRPSEGTSRGTKPAEEEEDDCLEKSSFFHSLGEDKQKMFRSLGKDEKKMIEQRLMDLQAIEYELAIQRTKVLSQTASTFFSSSAFNK